ncbi:hypothetical protein J2755_001767 [Methanohalophilus levihalophilus]|nr:hypothetical protein [Methanohalophilus levihalophilus]
MDRGKLIYKARYKQFKEQSSDSTRLQYIRVLVQALQAHNALLKTEGSHKKHAICNRTFYFSPSKSIKQKY